MDSCVPSEVRENVLDQIDALELDAPESDVDVTDTSTHTVILATTSDGRPVNPKINGQPEASEDKTDTAVVNSSESISSNESRHSRPGDVLAMDNLKSDDLQSRKRSRLRCADPVERSGSRSSVTSSENQPTELKTESSATTTGRLGSSDSAKSSSRKTVVLEPKPTIDNDQTEKEKTNSRSGSEASKSSTVRKTSSGSNETEKQVSSDHSNRSSRNREKPDPSDVKNSLSNTEKLSPLKRKGPKETKAIGYLVEAPERVQPCDPAKYPSSDIVYIRSLVRPFTADQLRQMITDHYGPVADLWLDRIKSTSAVRLESVEAAVKCREGLDGSRWPSMNPNTLRCDFGNDVLFAWLKEHGNSSSMPPPKHLFTGETEPTPSDTTELRKSKTDNVEGPETSEKRAAKPASARQHGEHSQSSRSKPADSGTSVDTKNKTEGPAKLLDDLFRKTTAAPSVYWLPLTEEQAQKQAEQRIKLFASKRSTTRSITQRATRSPFTSPARTDSNQPDPLENSTLDRSEVASTDLSAKSGKEAGPKRKSTDPVDVGRNKSSSPPAKLPKKEEDVDAPPRKRHRSPFTPERRVDNKPRTNSSDLYGSKRNRSPSPASRRPPRGLRPIRSRRSSTTSSSRSRSSTGPKRRAPVSSSSDKKFSRYGRPRSVERRAVSPLAARAHDRPRR